MNAINNRKLANLIAASETYAGGYIYPGARVTNSDWAPMRPILQTRLHFVKEYDRSPDGPRAAWNKRILARAPLGTVIEIEVSLCGGSRKEAFKKTGPCRWELFFVLEEDDRGGSEWTHERGWVYWEN
jgi:hypothetical protein